MQALAETIPQLDCFTLAFKQGLSSSKAGAKRFPVAADCVQPGRMHAAHRTLREPNTPLVHR